MNSYYTLLTQQSVQQLICKKPQKPHQHTLLNHKNHPCTQRTFFSKQQSVESWLNPQILYSLVACGCFGKRLYNPLKLIKYIKISLVILPGIDLLLFLKALTVLQMHGSDQGYQANCFIIVQYLLKID